MDKCEICNNGEQAKVCRVCQKSICSNCVSTVLEMDLNIKIPICNDCLIKNHGKYIYIEDENK